MQPILIKHIAVDRKAILFQHNTEKYFRFPWHYHQEMELILILKGEGTRFLGDSIERFEPGDLVLIGKDTPHVWQNPNTYYASDSTQCVEAIVLHFLENFHGDAFLQNSEAKFLKTLYLLAKQGLKVFGKSLEQITKIMTEMKYESDFTRILSLLKVLEIIHTSNEFKTLASNAFIKNYFEFKNERFNTVYNYLMENFQNKIRLADAAEKAHLSETAFCRFFKRHCGKSLTQFLKEIRIGYACQLLQEKDYTISQVALSSGYENLANFNKHFKELKQMPPKVFKKHF